MRYLEEIEKLIEEFRKKELYDEADSLEEKAQDVIIEKANNSKLKDKLEA